MLEREDAYLCACPLRREGSEDTGQLAQVASSADRRIGRITDDDIRSATHSRKYLSDAEALPFDWKVEKSHAGWSIGWVDAQGISYS